MQLMQLVQKASRWTGGLGNLIVAKVKEHTRTLELELELQSSDPTSATTLTHPGPAWFQ